MKVFVKLIAQAAEGVDKPEFWVFLEENSTLGDLLKKLERERGIKIDEKRNIVILINGRSAEFLGGTKARLKDMDKVIIMPVAAGG
ncbi:MoaD/ThiS family protein [Thermococcus aggregans]|uniref:MoaD/ThiS family protein n=1 Tax=Thermococcus aggregans TaxID=110163 RepID=A0A9E7MV99_THEAG|nr:MoaD/ThiS family protein [Thermococcus aggregans]USS39810.1 MoaD/ThiS family protein [Thermococcus aggregans]